MIHNWNLLYNFTLEMATFMFPSYFLNFIEKQLLILLEDLFMAGTETTSSTLSFVILYLVRYPQVQEKIHSELNRVVGLNQIPTMEHKDRYIPFR